MRVVSDEIDRLVAELGGSISAEHGLGQLKAKAAFDLKSQAERALMVTIKAGLDPQGIMNRGKLIPMDQLISG
jgi:FAD/FMN-containing dehydrogenase